MPTRVENYSPVSVYEEALSRASGAWGIQPEYWDIFGNRHVADPDVQRSILRSMGFNPDSVETLNEALRLHADLEWAVPAPPTLVLSLSDERVPVNIPASETNAAKSAELEATFHWEQGGSHYSTVPVDDMESDGEIELDGKTVRRLFLPLPATARLGYHKLVLKLGNAQSETRLILCPDRAYQPELLDNEGRASGIAISVYSLRSRRNWGCGDFTDLRHFTDWARKYTGVSFIALNPLHSIPNRQPYNTSPYLPNCSFYRNALYLDVEAIEDVRSSAEAQQLLASDSIREEFEQLRRSKYVEYEKVYALKLRFLALGFDEYLNGSRSPEFQSYVKTEGDLLDIYATYCALDESIHQQNPDIWIWPDWPEEFKDPKSEAVGAFRRENRKRIEFHKWVQWQVDRQLAAAQQHAKDIGLAIGLYHDLALATDRCGSDLWAHRRFYVAGCRVGSPPDDFSPSGQDWAFPPPNSLAHKLDGYRLFAESIRKNSKHGGALRIDHVMRFFRLFWIPEGKSASEGAYVLDYSDDLVRILALESVRNQVLIIGEDLGTVEPSIRETLRKFGVLSYRLLYFEKNASNFKTPDQYPRQALVSVSTHDLPTLAGFWENKDIEARKNAGVLPDEASYHAQLNDRAVEKQKLLDLFHRLDFLPTWFPRRASEVREFTGELHYAAVGFLATTPSELMVLNQEDLFKDSDQQNLPGTTNQYPNWRHKMRHAIEDFDHDPLAQACTVMFRRWMERSNRLNPET